MNLKFLSFIKNKKYSGWSPQERYKITDEETYPRRVGGLEKGSGLKTTLLHNINDTDYICRDQVQGFKIILHNPGIIPRVSKNFIRVPLNMDVTVVVKPNLVTTSKGLRNYHPKHRKCYFEHEKYLKFFKVYTQSNCELECLTNFTLKACNCVKFSMPRIDNMLICNQQQLSCYEKAEINYIKTESFQMSKNKDDKTPETICNCLPSCTSINYNYELTQFDLKFDRNSQIVSSKLSIFFKDGKVATKESLKFYGFNDFVADSGGLLGLFMGISFLSIIEIIYYFSLRLICNLNCRRKFSSTVNPATDDKITKIELIVN